MMDMRQLVRQTCRIYHFRSDGPAR